MFLAFGKQHHGNEAAKSYQADIQAHSSSKTPPSPSANEIAHDVSVGLR